MKTKAIVVVVNCYVKLHLKFLLKLHLHQLSQGTSKELKVLMLRLRNLLASQKQIPFRPNVKIFHLENIALLKYEMTQILFLACATLFYIYAVAW